MITCVCALLSSIFVSISIDFVDAIAVSFPDVEVVRNLDSLLLLLFESCKHVIIVDVCHCVALIVSMCVYS